jgi:trigger factor
MKVTQEKRPASQISLQIEIDPEVSQQAYDKALQKFMRTANIPGFRKGKVPRQVLIQRFGASQIKATVIEDLIQDSLQQALKQENIEAIGNIQLQSSFEELIQQFEPGAALTFSASVDVAPEVNVKQYKGLSVKAEEVKYDESRVNSVLEGYQDRMATLVPVEDRPAQAGDIAVVDFVGKLPPEDGSDAEPQEFPGGSAADFQVELSEGRFIPGFIEGIIGMAIDETKDVEAVFPENYPQEDLAGKPAIFTVTLKDLKIKELPELDDDFAQEVSEFETMAELRASLEERYKGEAEAATQGNKQKALLDELIKHVDVEVPETLIREEVDQMLMQTAMSLANQGIDIKQMFTREVVQRLREGSRSDAIIQIKRRLAIQEVADQESLTATDEEIQAKIEEFFENSRQDPAEVDMEKLTDLLTEELLTEKVTEVLETHGTVELLPEGALQPQEEAAEATPAGDAGVEAGAQDVEPEAKAADPVAEPESAPAEAESADPEAESPVAESTPESSESDSLADNPADKGKSKSGSKKKAKG